MNYRRVFLCLCALHATIARGAETILLPADGAHWTTELYWEGSKKAELPRAGHFQIIADPQHGPCLAIGPWRAGQYSMRYQWRDKIPLTRVTLKGFYRTEKLQPYEAEVGVLYFEGDKKLTRASAPLAPADDWTEFSVTFGRSADGADALRPGFGLSQHTEGRVLFRELKVETAAELTQFPEFTPKLKRAKPPKFQAGEFFRLQENEGSWWLVQPDGHAFFAAGTVGPGVKQGEALQPYAEFAAAHGFRCLGGWTSIWPWAKYNDAQAAARQPVMPLFYAIESNTLGGEFDYLTDAQGEHVGSKGHHFPDPFDPRYEKAYRAHVAEIAPLVKGKPWFIGWFADNEVSHQDLHRCVYSPYCAAAFKAWLQKKYGTIDALNKEWGSAFADFEALLAAKPDSQLRHGKRYDDFAAFRRVIVERYIDVTLRAIRAEDAQHLIFSNRFMLSSSSDWLALLELYAKYDGIAVNLYPANRAPGLDANERALLHAVHINTDKPVIIGEWSIPALDSGLYDDPKKRDWSYAETVANQTQRANQAAWVAQDFYNMAFVVGAHWFTWRDIDNNERKANRGLFKANGEAWTELQDALKRVQRGFQR